MDDGCSFADDAGELKPRLERFHAVVCQILEQVIECAYFIRDFCQDIALGMYAIHSHPFLRLNDLLRLSPLSYSEDEKLSLYGRCANKRVQGGPRGTSNGSAQWFSSSSSHDLVSPSLDGHDD